MTRSSEYPALMCAITAVCALAAVSGLVPVVEHAVGAALVLIVLGWVAVAVVRRELRIRRRLADPAGARVPAARSARCSGRSGTSAGPGEQAPVPPTTRTRTHTHDVQIRRAGDQTGRATQSTGGAP